MVGLRNNEIVYIPFTKAIKDDKPLDKDVVRAQEIMAS
jgi:6-phosphofructokinase 1